MFFFLPGALQLGGVQEAARQPVPACQASLPRAPYPLPSPEASAQWGRRRHCASRDDRPSTSRQRFAPSRSLTAGQWSAGPSLNQEVGGSIPARGDVSLSKTHHPELPLCVSGL